MKAITIHDQDSRNCLSFDLIDILRLLPGHTTESMWSLSNVEIISDEKTATKKLEDICNNGKLISGDKLFSLCEEITQVVDGEFKAFTTLKKYRNRNPWLIIEAIDSSFFIVACDDEALLNSVRCHFDHVEELLDYMS